MTEFRDIKIAYADERAEWRFAYYHPGERMQPHRHDCAQFSLVMTGTQRETSNGDEISAEGLSMALKPANFRHEAAFGDAGALLLSINLYGCGEDGDELKFQEWRVRDAHHVQREWAALAKAMLSRAPDRSVINDLTDDLLSAIMQDEETEKRASAPSWLMRAREALMETNMDAETIARDAGVHRVHLSRSFKRYFGMSVTEQRRRANLSRAATAIIRDKTAPACAAAAAGYSDQAHLTRHMRKETGMTPGALARIFCA